MSFYKQTKHRQVVSLSSFLDEHEERLHDEFFQSENLKDHYGNCGFYLYCLAEWKYLKEGMEKLI